MSRSLLSFQLGVCAAFRLLSASAVEEVSSVQGFCELYSQQHLSGPTAVRIFVVDDDSVPRCAGEPYLDISGTVRISLFEMGRAGDN